MKLDPYREVFRRRPGLPPLRSVPPAQRMPDRFQDRNGMPF
ncbi:MAG: hypothetical protein ACOYL3_21355 [Desulfuromonadaceae bacterium]